MTKENPKAFKHLINIKTLKAYLSPAAISPSQMRKYEAELLALELKERVRFLSKLIKENYPQDFSDALKMLLDVVEKLELKQFELWPATEFIQKHGLNNEKDSLNALYVLTQKFTAEFAIRPFLAQNPKFIYHHLLQLTQDENEHIRRWTSEGTRPRLPWGEKLKNAVQDPHEGLKILEKLKFDSSIYVQKSVGNHLNDISKDHPDLVIKTLKKWKKLKPKGYEKEFQFISRRALRSLIKQGHPQALAFFKVQANKVVAGPLKLNKKSIQVGDTLEFSVVIKNTTSKPQKYILDYEIGFRKSNQKLSQKVFKLKSGTLKPKEILKVNARQSFRVVSTRKLYPGQHSLAAKLNGILSKPVRFILTS